MAAIIFAGCVFILTIGFLWFWIARPILEDCGIIRVNDYQEASAPELHIMSRKSDEPARTERTNDRTNERSPHQMAWDAFLLDKTRVRLIEVMVDSDLTTTDIRALLKGESKTIGEEVDAARIRLKKLAPDQYHTPIANRPTNAAFYEADPELAYEQPPG